MMLLRAFRVLEVIIYMQMLPILMFGGMRSFLLNFPLTKLTGIWIVCNGFISADSACRRLVCPFLYQRTKVHFQITKPMTRCIASNIYYFLRGLLWVVSMNGLGHMTIYILSTPVLFLFFGAGIYICSRLFVSCVYIWTCYFFYADYIALFPCDV